VGLSYVIPPWLTDNRWLATELKRMRTHSSNPQQGSFIIEAMVSLLIFATALIALVGLAAQSMNQLGQTRSRNEASNLAGELISDMWVTATPATFDAAAWAGSTAVAGKLARLGEGVVAVSGTEITASSDGVEPCHNVTAITATQVFICISWADAKNRGTDASNNVISVRHFYRTSSEIVKN
jgi:type IV pilus assembly protein PilV